MTEIVPTLQFRIMRGGGLRLYGLKPGETLEALQQRLLPDQVVMFVYLNFEKVDDRSILLQNNDHVEFVVGGASYLLQVFDMLEEDEAVDVVVTRLEPYGQEMVAPLGIRVDWIEGRIPGKYFVVHLLVNGTEVTKETFRASAADVIIAVLDVDSDAA